VGRSSSYKRRTFQSAVGEDMGEEHQDEDFDTDFDRVERRLIMHPDTKHWFQLSCYN